MFGKKSNLIGLALSAICLFLVFRKVDWTKLVAALGSLQWSWLALAIGVFLTTFIIRTLRWQLLLAPAGHVPTKKLGQVLMVGYMANNVLPARLGELVRAYVLGQMSGIRKSTTLATILVERIFDGLSLLFMLGLVLAAIGMGWLGQSTQLPPWVTQAGLFASAGFMGAFAGVALLALWPQAATWGHSLITRFAPERLSERLHEMLDAFVGGVVALRSPKRLIAVFAASLMVWSIETTTYALMGQAFGLGLAPHAFLVTMVLVNLGTIAPSAPGFVGTFQALAVVSLGLFGIDHDRALSFGLVLHICEYLPVTSIGLAAMVAMNLSFQQVMHAGDEAEASPGGTAPLVATPVAAEVGPEASQASSQA